MPIPIIVVFSAIRLGLPRRRFSWVCIEPLNLPKSFVTTCSALRPYGGATFGKLRPFVDYLAGEVHKLAYRTSHA